MRRANALYEAENKQNREVAQRLIKKFGGEIRLESPEGQGTTCVITLPADKAGVRKEEPCVSP